MHSTTPVTRTATPPATGSSHRTLARLLSEATSLQPEYGDGLSSHLPMALQALQALGASSARLQAFYEQHAGHLQRRPASGAAPGAAPAQAVHDWQPLLGRFDQFEALQQCFATALRRQGRDQLLQQALPRLMDGVATAAFHGLIRTAHAVAAQHDGELAMGLAYWAARHAPLGATPIPSDAAAGSLDLPAWLSALQALPAPDRIDQRLISARVAAWAAVPGFASSAAALRLGPPSLEALAHHAAGLYAASGNFTVLHLVTACQALRQLLPCMAAADAPAALRHFSSAAAAGLLASGLPALQPPLPLHPSPPPWPQLIDQAVQADDAHLIKLVQACRGHAQASAEDRVFRQAASRALQA